jgi:hypothetical protein
MAEIFQQLPQDLSNEVLHWCTLRALLALASTSKLLRDLCDNPSIWETRFRGSHNGLSLSLNCIFVLFVFWFFLVTGV